MHAVQRQALATFLALACLCTASQGALVLLAALLLDLIGQDLLVSCCTELCQLCQTAEAAGCLAISRRS